MLIKQMAMPKAALVENDSDIGALKISVFHGNTVV